MSSSDKSKNIRLGKPRLGDRLSQLELFRLQMLEEDKQTRFEKKAKQVEQERLADIERARVATVKENLAQFGLGQLEEAKYLEQSELDRLFKEK